MIYEDSLPKLLYHDLVFRSHQVPRPRTGKKTTKLSKIVWKIEKSDKKAGNLRIPWLIPSLIKTRWVIQRMIMMKWHTQTTKGNYFFIFHPKRKNHLPVSNWPAMAKLNFQKVDRINCPLHCLKHFNLHKGSFKTLWGI